MSELIRNHDEKQAKLREIVEKINSGSEVKTVKHQFDRLIRNVSPEEIAALEQGLINEGMPVEQVQELCDLHVSVFQGALERQPPGKVLPGHPIHTYKEENKVARRKIKSLRRAGNRGGEAFSRALEEIKPLEVHYQRKENQLFPFLEQVDFTGPSKVMWGKHDEIRGILRQIEKVRGGSPAEIRPLVRQFAGAVRRMIFMEERILFPTALRKLPDLAWVDIRRGEGEIGYAWIQPGNLWDANVVSAQSSQAEAVASAAGNSHPDPDAADEPAERDPEALPLDVGALIPEQINLMLKALPVDVTYVDERNKVCYYSGGPHRVFPRSPGIIGRDVSNCHPPKSVHIVETIISSFRKRERESAEFWFPMKDRFLHIRYFALYNEHGNYKGTIEVSQDVTDIRALSGEQKLLDWASS